VGSTLDATGKAGKMQLMLANPDSSFAPLAECRGSVADDDNALFMAYE
jgi:hypothetical protein